MGPLQPGQALPVTFTFTLALFPGARRFGTWTLGEQVFLPFLPFFPFFGSNLDGRASTLLFFPPCVCSSSDSV